MFTLNKPLKSIVPILVSALLMSAAPLAKANPPEGRGEGPAAHGQQKPLPPVPPLLDIRGIAPQLKLNADQEKRYLKAEAAQGEWLQAGQYQLQKQLANTRAALADGKIPLSQLLKQQEQHMQDMQKQVTQVNAAWAAFYDSLDAGQADQVRQHVLARLSVMAGQDRWAGEAHCPTSPRPTAPGVNRSQD